MINILKVLVIVLVYLAIGFCWMPTFKKWMEKHEEFNPLTANDVLTSGAIWPLVLLIILFERMDRVTKDIKNPLETIVERWLFKDKK